MKTIRQLLDQKGHDVWSMAPEDWVYDAIEKMAVKECGALLVMEGDRPVGIVSERDYARKVILRGKSSKETKICEIMTQYVIYAHPEQTVEECMALMTKKHVRHLPVIDDENVCGMISIGDLVKSIIAEQQFVIEQLENYIYGQTV